MDSRCGRCDERASSSRPQRPATGVLGRRSGRSEAIDQCASGRELVDVGRAGLLKRLRFLGCSSESGLRSRLKFSTVGSRRSCSHRQRSDRLEELLDDPKCRSVNLVRPVNAARKDRFAALAKAHRLSRSQHRALANKRRPQRRVLARRSDSASRGVSGSSRRCSRQGATRK